MEGKKEGGKVVHLLSYFCTGHDSEIKGSDENDSERQSSDSKDNSDGDTQSDCSDCFEVMFQTQRSKNVTVQKQRIHVNISRRGRGMGCDTCIWILTFVNFSSFTYWVFKIFCSHKLNK